MNTKPEFVVEGFDPNHIRRIWGEGPTEDIARTRAAAEALDYVKGRPDTGPVGKWHFALRKS